MRPAADTAYRLAAARVLRPLDAARVRERRALAAAKHAAGQDAPPRSFRAPSRPPPARIAPLAPAIGAAAGVPVALRRAATAYAGLARAAAHRDKRAWNRAKAAVHRAEVRVTHVVTAAG